MARRLLIGSAEDGHSIEVMETVAGNFQQLTRARTDILYLAAEVLRICKMPNWWHPFSGGKDLRILIPAPFCPPKMFFNKLLEVCHMAKILPDREIKKLLGTVILNSDPDRINPNGIEVRLGKHVLFQSTDEERELGPGSFLKVLPGESVTISSFEQFDFRKEAIQKVFPGCDLMAFVTPTTTMMREGIMQTATKVDSGWHGTLNWGLRNSSIRDFILGYCEPIFKLTLFLLAEDEVPDVPYGERPEDRYQDAEGITRSNRKIPASIPKGKVVSSSIEKLDPNKQLREAGYPFDHIGRELTEMQGKWEVVSSDVMLLKTAITDETKLLTEKVDDAQNTLMEKVEHLFQKKFIEIVGAIVSCIAIMYGVLTFIRDRGIQGASLGLLAVMIGLVIALVVFLVSRRTIPKK
jgi:deoxycytidine triphosphate deaminase